MKNFISEKYDPYRHPYFYWLLKSFQTTMLLEVLSRRSILDAVIFLLDSPAVFAVNMALVMSLYSLAFLFKRGRYVIRLVTIAICAVGIVDFVLLLFRTTPFTAQDFLQLKSAAMVMKHYVSWFAVVIVSALLVLLLVLLIIWFRRADKNPVKLPLYKSIPIVLGSLCFSALIVFFAPRTNLLPKRFANIAQAYQDYGLAYCFMSSMVNTGIDRPENYGEEELAVILESEVASEAAEPVVEAGEFPNRHNEEEPATDSSGEILYGSTEGAANVIFVQLESFYDLTHLKDVELSADPTPYFHKLEELYSTGFLSVPGVGAGTANTEFEVMTGLNLDFFGPGEYPYQTVLKNMTCESLAYIFHNLGYTSQAIHNNSATFYQRNEVFSQLGYDVFTSLEYMNNVTYTENGWAKDAILSSTIVDALRSTDTKDYIYCISVQGHGAYPTEDILVNKVITAEVKDSEGKIDEARSNQLTYYVNQEYEMDRFVRNLCGTLRAYPEPCVVVFYGDHLPALGITEEEMALGDMYQTNYVIWSNYEMDREVRDVEAYQLGALVLKDINISQGVMFRYHQKYLTEMPEDDTVYLDGIAMLGYDMLYGDQTVYENGEAYKPTALQMGINPIRMNGLAYDADGDALIASGQNFTQASIFVINGKQYTPTERNNHTLILEHPPKGDLSVCVAQLDDYGKAILSTTYIYHKQIPKN